MGDNPERGGFIDPKELQAAMSSLGFETDEELLKNLINQAEQNGDGKISFEEFLDLMTVKKENIQKKESLQELFALFDPLDGYI